MPRVGVSLSEKNPARFQGCMDVLIPNDTAMKETDFDPVPATTGKDGWGIGNEVRDRTWELYSTS